MIGLLPTEQRNHVAVLARAAQLRADDVGLDSLLCEDSRLYKTGGIKELRALGYVKNKRGVGYYRPDARLFLPFIAAGIAAEHARRAVAGDVGEGVGDGAAYG